jgi:MFS family permease
LAAAPVARSGRRAPYDAALPGPEPRVSRPSTFAALQHRNFRLLWIGQIISLCGSMMQSTAILWHVTLLVAADDKPLALAMVGLSRVVPIVVFSLVGGVVADALDRRRLMLATQVLATLVASLLAYVTFRGLSSPLPIYVLAGLSSAVNAFDAPARQALLPSLVPRAILPNALSLYSTMFQVAAVAGPALGGLMLEAAPNDPTGPGWVYAANALSFLAVIVSLLMMRDLPSRAGGERKPVRMGSAMEGLRFVFREPLIRSTMLLDFFATFFASALALLPIFAQDILHVGESGYGLLASAQAVGAFVAGLAMARFEPAIRRRGPVLLWSVAAYGLTTIGFGLSPTFLLAFLCLALSGAADTVSMVLRNIIRQTRTPDELRGRMTSVNMIFFMGGPQLGEVEAGLVAKAVGAVWSVVSGGLGCLAATGWIAKATPALRRYGRDEEPITPELAQKAVSQQPEPANPAG